MSAQGGGQKRSPVLLFVGVVVLAIAISAAAYVLLVVSENAKADKFRNQLETIRQEVEQASAYLHRHQSSVGITKQNVQDEAEELKHRVPYGPVDLTVGGYIDQAAQQAGILDVKWSVEGGLKVPKNPFDDKRTPEQRLLMQPSTLKRTTIVVEFHARYKEFLQVLKSLAMAPWLVEVTKVRFRREGGPKLTVNVEMRYAFE